MGPCRRRGLRRDVPFGWAARGCGAEPQAPSPGGKGVGDEGTRRIGKYSRRRKSVAPHPNPSPEGEGQIARQRGAFPARHKRWLIGIEIVRLRPIAEDEEMDVPEPVDRDQRIPPGALLPLGSAGQVPEEPWPEQWPDLLEEETDVRVHAWECGAVSYPVGFTCSPSSAIPDGEAVRGSISGPFRAHVMCCTRART